MSHGIRAAGRCEQVRLAPDWAPYSRRYVCHDAGRNIIEKNSDVRFCLLFCLILTQATGCFLTGKSKRSEYKKVNLG